MKIVDISFYFGIVVVILTFITMVCFVWEDIHKQREKNYSKYREIWSIHLHVAIISFFWLNFCIVIWY